MSEVFVFRDPNALAKADAISARRERVRVISLEAVGVDPAIAAASFIADIRDADLLDAYNDVKACKAKLSGVPGVWSDADACARLAFFDAVLDLIRNKPARM